MFSFIKEALAKEDPTKPNTEYLPFHYLKERWCVIADVEFELYVFGTSVLPNISGTIDFNGSKKVCKSITQDIYCYLPGQTECSSASD